MLLTGQGLSLECRHTNFTNSFPHRAGRQDRKLSASPNRRGRGWIAFLDYVILTRSSRVAAERSRSGVSKDGDGPSIRVFAKLSPYSG